MSYGVGHYIVGGGHYNPHTPPPSCNHAAYTPDSLEAEVSKGWQPIGEIVNVDADLYSRFETNLKLYITALNGRDGSSVKNIGTDLREAFNKVLLIMGGNFRKSPFGTLHKRYAEITERYMTKPPQKMDDLGVGAMFIAPHQLQLKK